MENILKITGKLYKQELEFKQDDKNRNYVRGSIGILINEKTNQVEKVDVFIYAKTKQGKANKTYELLERAVKDSSNFYENDKQKCLSVTATCNLTVRPYYKLEKEELVLKEARSNRLVFLNEDNVAPSGAAFSIDCEIKSIVDRVDDKGMLTGESDLNVAYYDSYSGVSKLRFRVSNPDYVSIIRSRFIEGADNFMNLGGRITDIVTTKETPKETAFGVNTVSVSQNSVKVFLIESGDFLEPTEELLTLRKTAFEKYEEIKSQAKAYAQKKAENTTPKSNVGSNQGFGANTGSTMSGFKF